MFFSLNKIQLQLVRCMRVRLYFFFLFSLFTTVAIAQLPGVNPMDSLQGGGSLPQKLLNGRTVVLYDHATTSKEINLLHEELVRTGIDAVAYYEIDRVFAGYDVTLAFADYFVKREVANVFILKKSNAGYGLFITAFSGNQAIANSSSPAWSVQHTSLRDALQELYRTALSIYKKQNLLINPMAEINPVVDIITGKRAEAIAYDLKVDKLAVPKFGIDSLDKQLEEILKAYTLRYELVDPAIPETELRKKGFLYILRFVHSRGVVLRELMEYDVSKAESAFVSVTYPEKVLTLKTIPANTPVYKFYPRRIDSGDTYLGIKWDADVTWQKALDNFIKSFKAELRIE